MSDELLKTSFLYGGSAEYISRLYAQYERDPQTVPQDWRQFFSQLGDEKEEVLKNVDLPSWKRKNWPLKPSSDMVSALDGNWTAAEQHETAKKEKAHSLNKEDTARELPQGGQENIENALRVFQLINAYRSYGHYLAQLDPLHMESGAIHVGKHPELELSTYGFTEEDFNRPFYINGFLGKERASLAEVVETLKSVYCHHVGAEFMHIPHQEEREFFISTLEGDEAQFTLSANEKKKLLQKLVEAEGFEQFLDAKYKGTKRFGLDGGEALIPALEFLIEKASQENIEEIVFGMAHRGRLNVLSQILYKTPTAIFYEFKGGSYKPENIEGSGDVKYHLGASCDRTEYGKKMHLSLAPNPSHLEIVDPVVIGKARARQDHKMGALRPLSMPLEQRTKVLPVLLHGDAAFAGQGVVQETLGLSGLAGYTVAGSLHFIINNQVGFTTDPGCSRSTAYSSDIAKMINAPILHVNGDDPEAVVKVTKIALAYRQKFHKPIVIDLYCYRRYGHNEGDEPAFTQPLMYKIIRAHKTTLNLYSEALINEKVVTPQEVEELKQRWRSKLEEAFSAADQYEVKEADWLKGAWSGLESAQGKSEEELLTAPTGVKAELLKSIGQALVQIPSGFQLHRTIQRFVENRRKILEEGENLDWSTAEALAFGSLLLEGHAVRLSGEDVERGTFSQRHSVVYDQESKEAYAPLNHIKEGQALYEPVNSMLSEEAVLGYEYGYSTAEPQSLVLWEGQFGDFANGAQVVFDQFLSSAESKWLRMSGLVCLLPHGFEGQGPEHSSARLERFLQLCAENNMQVANCSTPANYYHILRRQLKRSFRKPLVLMTPKSLLRHKRAVSSLKEFESGSEFKPILLDDAERLKAQPIKLAPDEKIRRVIVCSGKVYYDLCEEREKRGLVDVYLLRLEQFYPFPYKLLASVLRRFEKAEIVWCQEEPKNMGAWFFVAPYLQEILGNKRRLIYAGRKASASPAVGLPKEHAREVESLLETALTV